MPLKSEPWTTLNIQWVNQPGVIKNRIKNKRKKKKEKFNSKNSSTRDEAKWMQQELNMMKNHRRNCTQLNKDDITCSDNSSSSGDGGSHKTYKMYATSSGSNSCWWRRFISIAVLIQILANCGKFNCVSPCSFSRFHFFHVVFLLFRKIVLCFVSAGFRSVAAIPYR